MPTHFSAFISYRHCEPDATIAGQIQRQLEHFKIPRSTQKETGVKKIDRIFRDKEELPLSSNLGDDIEDALRNSDFLIVICSPRLQESAWCQREIALFLESHPIERVLTVLAEGEPQDVVPEILRTNREPLSCDYRMAPRKAREIELPRLAAAIIGCRYDDLRQRQKQYKARRRTAILCAALAMLAALSVYYYRTSQEIQKNYEQALRNQSKFLASESLEVLEDGDRLTAISLALEAVPQWEDQRPWVPEAEFALIRAVNAYGSSSEVLAVNAFTHNATVTDYFTSFDGEQLISWDEHSQVYVWDTRTYALLNTFSSDMELTYQPVLQLPDHRLLVGLFDSVRCYDYMTGQLLWEAAGLYGSDLVLSQDYTLAVTGYSSTEPLSILDTATGEVVQTLALPDELTQGFPSIKPIAFSPDGSYLALTYSRTFGENQILSYHLDSGRCAVSEFSMRRVDKMLFTGDNRLLVSGRTEDGDYSASFLAYGLTSLTKDQADLYCLDPDTAQITWENYFNFYLVFFDSSLQLGEYPMEDGSVKDVLCCTYANVCSIFDVATGELIQRLEIPDSAAACEYEDGMLYWFLTDGSYCVHRLGGTVVSALTYFPDAVVDAETNYGFFVRTTGSFQILLYQAVADDHYTVFGEETPMSYADRVVAVSDNYMVVRAGYQDVYYCYDLKEQKYLQTLQIDESNRQSILGMMSDGCSVVILDKTNCALSLVNLASGETREIALPCDTAEGYNTVQLDTFTAPFLSGDTLGYVVQSYNTGTTEVTGGSVTVTMGEEQDTALYLLDLVSGEHTVVPLFTAGINDYAATILTPNSAGTHILVTTKRYDEDYSPICETQLLELRTGEKLPITDIAYSEYGELPAITWSGSNNKLAAISTDGIRVWRTDGTLMSTLEVGEKQPVSVTFDPEESHILVLFDDASLHRYTVYGTLVNRGEVYIYRSGLSSYSEISWQFTDAGLLINADRICTLLDTSTWAPYAYVRQCMHYDANTDRFYVSISADGGYIMGCYQRYSTQDLISMAQEILGENELTEEQRSKYGLD